MGSRGYDLAWGSVLRSLTWSHTILDRVSGGRLGNHFPGGQQVVWLTSRGHRSGRWRRTPLLAVHEDGDPQKPWLKVHNESHQAVFSEATGEERDLLYRQLARIWSSYEK